MCGIACSGGEIAMECGGSTTWRYSVCGFAVRIL